MEGERDRGREVEKNGWRDGGEGGREGKTEGGETGRRDGWMKEGKEEEREDGQSDFLHVAAPLIIAVKDKVRRLHIKWVNVVDGWCGTSLKEFNYCAQDRLGRNSNNTQRSVNVDESFAE